MSQNNPFINSNKRWSAFGFKIQHQNFVVSESQVDSCRCNETPGWRKTGNVGLLFSYYNNAGKRLSYALDFGASSGRLGTEKLPTILASTSSFISFRGDLYYQLGHTGQYIMPFLHTGVQSQFAKLKNQLTVPLGAGLRYQFKNSPAMITAEMNYGWAVSNDLRNNMNAAMGVYFRLHDKKTVDTDGDGVEDKRDNCPSVAGPASNKGCPVDSDGDGIVDDKDKCPTVAGIAENGGCPDVDTDGDGVVDRMDNCPAVKGASSNKGCPLDTDGDGIADDKDKCPTVAGIAENNGCPDIDTDGDGIVDRNDKCVNEKGPASNKGCPEADVDGDGIVDKLDKCPSEKGIAANNGCPELAKEETFLVNFNFGKFDLSLATDTLKRLVTAMKTNPTKKCELVGHTDPEGDVKYNLELSNKRVSMVKKYLIAQGVMANRIITAYHGKADILVQSKDRNENLKNRRVEIRVF